MRFGVRPNAEQTKLINAAKQVGETAREKAFSENRAIVISLGRKIVQIYKDGTIRSHSPENGNVK